MICYYCVLHNVIQYTIYHITLSEGLPLHEVELNLAAGHAKALAQDSLRRLPGRIVRKNNS